MSGTRLFNRAGYRGNRKGRGRKKRHFAWHGGSSIPAGFLMRRRIDVRQIDNDIAGDMRIVLDTNVFVAALRSPSGGSAELIRRIRAEHCVMLASVPLFMEYEAVATRQNHLQAARISRRDVEMVLDVLARFVEPIEIHYLWRPRLRDPADDMVLEVAVNGVADALVTFNRADFAGVTEEFGIEICGPGDILRRT